MDDENSLNTIHKACKEGDIERVEQFLNEDPSLVHVKDSTEFKTPLFYACGHFQTDIVQLLLEHGANVNEETPKKWTPLHEVLSAWSDVKFMHCTYMGSPYVLDTVRDMLRAGADPNATDVRGETPWSEFISVAGDVEVVKMLFEHGLDVTMKVDGRTVSRLSAEVSGYYGDHCVEVMKLCLVYGSDVNEVDEKLGTLLHTLMKYNGYSDTVDVPYKLMAYILKKGFKEIDRVWKGKTALTLVAGASNLKTVILLLQHGARVDIDYPLHFLSLSLEYYKKVWADYQIANVLIQHGAKVNPDLRAGKETVKILLLPRNDPARIKVAKKMVKMIFRENVLLLPSRIGRTLHLPCSTVEMLQSPNLQFIPYFYSLGYRLSQIDEVVKGEKEEDNLTGKAKQIVKQVKEIDAFSLQAICRFHLRKILGSPLSGKVEKLPITQVMKDYLYMKEMV